jgi:hypothetical protein
MVSEVADDVGYVEVELAPAIHERNGADANLDHRIPDVGHRSLCAREAG